MVSNLIPLLDLLADKKGETKEAHLILFEKCNLRCTFCHQDHDSTVGMDGAEILKKVHTLIEVSDPETPIIINMTGGELFSDDIPDELFTYYQQAGELLLGHFKRAKLVWGTNLIYQKLYRVERLMVQLSPFVSKDQTVCLATSFDPAGRFTAAQRVEFMENVEYLALWIDTVNVVITRQNIAAVVSGREEEILKTLCEDFSVYFDHYIPSEAYEQHQPTEVSIKDLYLYLDKHHPNSHPIQGWKKNNFNDTTCRSTKIINKDGVVTTCWSEAGKDAILDEGKGLAAKQLAEDRFLEKYDCLSCEYYQRCGLRCFLHHSFVDDGNSDCEIKKMFDKIL